MAVVRVDSGSLAGSETEGIHSFKGIPYAAPISGEARWLPPALPEAWSGQRDATRFGNICTQESPPNKWLAGPAGKIFMETLWVDEPAGDDCLNLNVWTPSLDPEAKLPVLVWIHGGAYTTGSGSLPIYEGHNLARKEVVVVSINYRLGLMGSFTAPGMFDDDFCGPNRGFLDQMAALRWVQDNISQFGGDRDNVTIFGESAGGQSVAALLASPAMRGLFKRAIAQSGTPEIGSPVSAHERFAPDLLAAIGIKPGDRSAIAALTARDTVSHMAAARKLIAKGGEEKYGELAYNGNIGVQYGDVFQPVSILDSLAQGVASDIDLMIGSVKEDGRLFPLVMPGPQSLAAWMCMFYFKGLMKPRNEHKLVFEKYRQAMPQASKTEVRNQVVTDCMFRRGSVKAAEAHAATSSGRTWLYQFDWATPVKHGAIGAIHGIDVPFCNQNLEAFAALLGDIEPLRELANTVSDTWVNFARHGKPAADRLPDWHPFDAQDRATMVFNDRIELRHDVDPHLRAIWDG
ncbi:MAG: carboxylesterase family protein [Pseudomonadota bacterium]